MTLGSMKRSWYLNRVPKMTDQSIDQKTDQKIDLALAFLQAEPSAAAGILEQLPTEQVAAFLNDLPYTHAATILGKMFPQYSARLCKCLEPATAAAMLSDMEVMLVAPIVRLAGKELGKQLLDQLPDKTSIACRLLLNYSEEAVGAWMLANVSTIPDDCNVDEALARIRSEQKTFDTGSTYVIGRDRRLKGILNLTKLIRSTPNLAVSLVMEKHQDSILARTPLVNAINHPIWNQRDYLPVTNRQQQLIGVLRYADLRQGLDKNSTSMEQPGGTDSVTGMVEAYGKSLIAMFDVVADIASTKPPQR